MYIYGLCIPSHIYYFSLYSAICSPRIRRKGAVIMNDLLPILFFCKSCSYRDENFLELNRIIAKFDIYNMRISNITVKRLYALQIKEIKEKECIAK